MKQSAKEQKSKHNVTMSNTRDNPRTKNGKSIFSTLIALRQRLFSIQKEHPFLFYFVTLALLVAYLLLGLLIGKVIAFEWFYLVWIIAAVLVVAVCVAIDGRLKKRGITPYTEIDKGIALLLKV